jgi:murein DD-endopeptidase MepM/ murein hydrolase activator NlpD
MRAWILLALLGAAVVGVLLAWPHLEGASPEIESPAEVMVGSDGGTLRLVLSDAGTGLRSFDVRIRHGGGGKTLVEQQFTGGLLAPLSLNTRHEAIEIPIQADALAIPDGAATLVLSVRDWSWRDAGKGNRSELSIPLRVDTVAPQLSVESGLTYVYRGGSAAAVYQVGEETRRDGVMVGETFFRGYPMPGSDPSERRRFALFAIPIDAPASPQVGIIATDLVGNESHAPFPARVFERKFSKDPIRLSTRFLENVIPDLASSLGVDASDRVAAFQQINSEVRARNEEQIREEIAGSGDTRHWAGAFEQLRNSKVTSRFAEHRTYLVEGEEVSQATHYGFDLASNAAAPITASNAGVVLFAGELGIYGNCVLIDHGQGLVTLYGHLSQLDVAPGERVEKSQPLGRSGATGLAGGDHLHFAILVGGTYVDPLEWWDPRWVKTHVEVRLAPSSR